MSTTPLPIDQFAAKVRGKYPGAYDHLSDAQLVQKVVDKHPEYKESIASFSPTQAEQLPPRSVTDAFDPKAEGTAQRFLGSAGAALLSVPGAILRTGLDPVGTARDIVSSVGNAVKTYANPATRPTMEGIESVLPEALGTGFGNAAAAYTPEAAYGAKQLAGTALRDPYNEVRAPIKAAAAAGKLLGAPELSEAFIPNRPGAYSAAERAAVPLSQSPNAANLNAINAARKAAGAPPPAPEPELGSPENPGFMSKLPSRLPRNLRSDPFAPPVEESAEAGRQAEASSPTGVTVFPEPNKLFPGQNENYAASIPRNELEDLALAGKPGAGKQLQQLGKSILYTPKGAGIETPSMSVLRDSLGIKGNADPFAPAPPEIPQGNDSPFQPSVAQGWLRPRKVLQ